jgi:DNA-directed RNA polymerase specialized sigma24 family protein
MSGGICPILETRTRQFVLVAASLQRLLQEKREEIGPKTSGGVLFASGGSRGYSRTSHPESWVVENSETIEKVERLLDAVRDLELTWLEAGVLMHYYFRGFSLEDAADIMGCHVAEAQAAERSLIEKVARRLFPGEL